VARFKADLNIVVAADDATVETLSAKAQALVDACAAAGGDVRGNGIEVKRDASAAPAEEPPKAKATARAAKA